MAKIHSTSTKNDCRSRKSVCVKRLTDSALAAASAATSDQWSFLVKTLQVKIPF